jgi:hypothetical protein
LGEADFIAAQGQQPARKWKEEKTWVNKIHPRKKQQEICPKGSKKIQPSGAGNHPTPNRR